MRYLFSISLALIVHVLLSIVVLMALACTAEPAEPTPSGAFSCMELADKLAAAQTETAASVLTRSWNESGCAQKVAGVTKVPTAISATGSRTGSIWPDMTGRRTLASGTAKSKTEGPPIAMPGSTKTPVPPTVTPDPWANANLKGRSEGMVVQYMKAVRAKTGKTAEEERRYDGLAKSRGSQST